MTRMWQLLKVFRRNLWMYLGIEIVIVFLIAVNDIRAHHSESVLESLGVSALLALILSLCLRMPSRLNRMPFPVPVRQRAMLPALAFAVLWGGGISAIFAASLFVGVTPFEWGLLGWLMLKRMPFYLLAFLVVYRFFQLVPHLFGIVFMFMFLPKIMNDHDNNLWVSWYFLALPAALAMIVFYLKEIPEQLARRDRLLISQSPNQPVSMRDLNIESRHSLFTWIGRVLDAVLTCAAVLCVVYVAGKSFRSDLTRVDTYIAKPWLCWFPLFGVFLCYSLLREGYGRAVASGFGPYASAWMSVMRLTIILNPLTKMMGTKKGVLAQCDQCRMAKFIWAQACPHCGFPGPGTLLNKQMARLARGDTVRISMRQKIIFRLFIPLQLLLMFGVFGRAGSRPFELHAELLTFEDAQVAQKAAVFLEAWVDTHSDTETWLRPDAPQVQVPKKYRLQIAYTEGAPYMSLQAYGLRWDSASQLPGRLIDHLGQSLKQVCDFAPTPTKLQSASSPFMQTRTYLDNRLHWVQRDNDSPRNFPPITTGPLLEKPGEKMPVPPPIQVE